MKWFIGPYRVYTQAVFWVVVFALYIVLKEYPQRMTGVTLICLVFQETLELALPSYTQNLLVLPLFRQKRWLLGTLAYLLQVVVLIFLLPYVLNAVGYLFGLFFHVTDLVDWRKEHIAFSIVAFTVIATCVKLAVDRLLLEKERRENELRHLKAQLNPHFLFNSLNNLYGLAVATGSGQLSEHMLKLSDLLRYSLYDTSLAFVPLQKELDYIANYVALERLRLSDKARISLSADVDASGVSIAPLLLIVFIENCFKHFSSPRGTPAVIDIVFALEGKRLRMNVRNTVDPDYNAAPAPARKDSAPPAAAEKGGIGLVNVRQRLDLIYPGRYVLAVDKGSDFFEVRLHIELDRHDPELHHRR
ncbi:sensor histidine kinase [Dinghuibacter silviterrae]|uniref:Histidine kinase n=1 Tax=Dinghuibacter silviterrae TaxID=1539049 RepID=A0A4R8DET9_9BACT|nr:histidine kinase [Dinghuibacter silviterrae]TDW96071.1 histidine kinase [Dinghuibacter silviterrae]